MLAIQSELTNLTNGPKLKLLNPFLSDINDDYVHTCHAVTEHVIAQAMAVI